MSTRCLHKNPESSGNANEEGIDQTSLPFSLEHRTWPAASGPILEFRPNRAAPFRGGSSSQPFEAENVPRSATSLAEARPTPLRAESGSLQAGLETARETMHLQSR